MSNKSLSEMIAERDAIVRQCNKIIAKHYDPYDNSDQPILEHLNNELVILNRDIEAESRRLIGVQCDIDKLMRTIDESIQNIYVKRFVETLVKQRYVPGETVVLKDGSTGKVADVRIERELDRNGQQVYSAKVILMQTQPNIIVKFVGNKTEASSES